MTGEKDALSIWFFIGGLLAIYGVLITGAGIWDLLHPPAVRVVLDELHAGIWWGGLLLVLGLFYVVHFRPRKG